MALIYAPFAQAQAVTAEEARAGNHLRLPARGQLPHSIFVLCGSQQP
jgi:hypothetical protein